MTTDIAMSAMDHSMHDMAAMSSDSDSSQNCCDMDGLCSMASCLMTIGLPGLPMLNLPPAAIALLLPYPLLSPERTLDSHFRPPIFP